MVTSLRFFYLSFLLICAASAVAQTGPGGVGNASGSGGQPQNRLWLRADAGTSTTTNGQPVSGWNDQSGNGNVASQTGAARPTYQSGVVNGKPVLRFNTSGGTASQSIRVNSALGVAQTGGFHYFIVTKRNGTLNSFGSLGTGGGATGGVYLLDRTTATTPLASLKALPGNLYGFQKRDNASNLGGVSSTTQIDGTNFQIVNYQRQRGVAYRLFLNGTQEGGDLTDADGDLLPPITSIGSHQDANPGGSFDGDIAEVLIYGTSLNAAQRIIVDNYLSSKYAVTISGDRYSFDATHGNDVAGIGRVDASNTHTNASSSRLNLNTPSTLTDNGFLLYGHDNGDLTLNNTNAPSNRRRLNRVWRANVTGGGVGTVTISFDVTGIVLPTGESFRVFVDADGDFSSGATELTGTLSGSTFTVTTASIPDGSYITLGRTFAGPSAPISLVYTPSTLTLTFGTGGVSPTPIVDDGGSPITSYALVSPPSGITINPTTGVITVGPATALGAYNLTVDVTNGIGTTTFTNVYTVTINPADASQIVYQNLQQTTTFGTAIAPATSNFPAGFTYSLFSGSLGGLTLNTDGSVTGTLSAEGSTSGVIRAVGIAPNTGTRDFPFTFAAVGSTGPGGVGAAASNSVWFRADAGTSTTTDGAPVDSWNDQSGNGRTAVSSGTNRPVYQGAVANGRPVLRFNGNQFIGPSASMGLPAAGGHHYFIVLKANASVTVGGAGDGSGTYILDRSTAGNPLASLKAGTGGVYAFQKRTDAAAGLTWVLGTTPISTTTFQIVDYARYRNVAYRLFVNSVQEGVDFADTDGNTTPDPIRIGRHSTNPGGGLDGDIAEVAVYGAAVNTAQRLIVENYLSAKYNISITNDFYAGTSPYLEQVHGIGTTDGSANKHTRAQSSGGLALEERNTSLNATNEFLLAGHDGTNPLPVSTADLPSGVQQRWSRIWYLDKTGAVDARIAFDFSDADVSAIPANPTNYRLLYRAGTSGPFSEVTIVGTPFIQNTDQVAFDVNDANLIDGYYTLATTNPVDSPLPVELISFTLAPKDNGVLIEWKTASETDNVGFILQRSFIRDGVYTEVASYRTNDALKGLGTSPNGKTYAYFDNDRLQTGQTYFYKLLDVDFSGNITEHPVKEITLPREYSLSQNYPNPFNPTTTIEFSLRQDGRTVLEIYSVLGQKVATLVDGDLKAGAYQIQFNGARLSSGLYFYRLRSGAFVSIKKMMLVK